MRFRRDLTARHKPAGVITIVVAHRAHRLAFALMRTGSTYDAARWAESVTHQDERRERQAGGSVSSTRRLEPDVDVGSSGLILTHRPSRRSHTTSVDSTRPRWPPIMG
jgi:hypothetical protein